MSELEIPLRGGLIALVPGVLMSAFDEVFLREVYAQALSPPLRSVPVAVDVGAHVGLFATWAARQARDARVFSFEAHPVNFKLLTENISQNRLDRVTAYHQAVSGSGGTARLYEHEEGYGGNSLYKEHVKQEREKYLDVPSTTLDDIVRDHGIQKIDLLKLDCEGAEYEILYKASPDTLRKVRRIGLEYHRVPGQSVAGLQDYLAKQGFRCRLAGAEPVLYAWREERA